MEPTPFDDIDMSYQREPAADDGPLSFREAILRYLGDILRETRHMNSAERSGAVSSCKITLQRGTVDVAVHAYVGSDIQEAEDQALQSYRRVMAGLNQDGVEAFSKTLEAMKK